jgi:hypothetical protein
VFPLSSWIKRKTRNIRYSLAKKIAPNLYENSRNYHDIITHTPRPMIVQAKKYFAGQPALNAVEIGVAQGDTSLSMLSELFLGKFWLVDPYAHAGAMVDFDLAKQKVAAFSNVTWLIKPSSEAAKEIAEPLDLVYIDGNHEYEFVKEDIALYYPLVKGGGMIGGHDYQNYWSGVIAAVNEFAAANNLKLNICPPDWWIVKP